MKPMNATARCSLRCGFLLILSVAACAKAAPSTVELYLDKPPKAKLEIRGQLLDVGGAPTGMTGRIRIRFLQGTSERCSVETDMDATSSGGIAIFDVPWSTACANMEPSPDWRLQVDLWSSDGKKVLSTAHAAPAWLAPEVAPKKSKDVEAFRRLVTNMGRVEAPKTAKSCPSLAADAEAYVARTRSADLGRASPTPDDKDIDALFFRWLNDATVKRRHSRARISTEERQGDRRRLLSLSPYVLVTVIEEAVEPRVTKWGRASKVQSGQTIDRGDAFEFVPGRAKGWAMVVGENDGEVVCAQAIDVDSSSSMTSAGADADVVYRLRFDLAKQFADASWAWFLSAAPDLAAHAEAPSPAMPSPP